MRKTKGKLAAQLKLFFKKEGGFGLNEILGVAAALIIAAFIIIPQLRDLAGEIMGGLADWWDNISDSIFQTS